VTAKQERPYDAYDMIVETIPRAAEALGSACRNKDKKYRVLREAAEKVWLGALPNRENPASCLVAADAIDSLGRVLGLNDDEVEKE
jgi:hypothetical protein